MKAGNFWRVGICLPNHSYMALLPWRWLNTCLPMGSREFWLFVCKAFTFPIKMPLSQDVSFLPLPVPIVPLIPLVGEWAGSCWLGLNHDGGSSHLTSCLDGKAPHLGHLSILSFMEKHCWSQFVWPGLLIYQCLRIHSKCVLSSSMSPKSD